MTEEDIESTCEYILNNDMMSFDDILIKNGLVYDKLPNYSLYIEMVNNKYGVINKSNLDEKMSCILQKIKLKNIL